MPPRYVPVPAGMVAAGPLGIYEPEQDAPEGLPGARVHQGHGEVSGHHREQDIGGDLVKEGDCSPQARAGRQDPEEEARRGREEKAETGHEGVQLLPAVEPTHLSPRIRVVPEPAGQVPEKAPVGAVHLHEGPAGPTQDSTVTEQRDQNGEEKDGHTRQQVQAQPDPSVVTQHERLEPAEAEEEAAQEEDERREGDAPVEGPLRGAEPDDDGRAALGRAGQLRPFQPLAFRDARRWPVHPSFPKRD